MKRTVTRLKPKSVALPVSGPDAMGSVVRRRGETVRTTNALRVPKMSAGAIGSGRSAGGVGQPNFRSGVPP